MNRRTALTSLGTSLVIAPLFGGCARPEPGDETRELRPAALEQAHEAYLKGDWQGLTERVREVLTTPKLDDAARDNALALLDKAYEVNTGKLPTAWSLPPGIQRLRYLHVRAEVEGDGVHHRVVFGGSALPGVSIAQLRVSRHPDQVLLDRRMGVGTFDSHDEGDHQYFEIESDELAELPGPGVYTFVVELANGARTDGWFLVDRLSSTAAPKLVEPEFRAVVRDEHPRIAWEDFYSPDFRPFEQRTLALYLMHRDPSGKVVSPWSLWTDAIDELGEVRIGEHALGSSNARLFSGDYCVAASFGEARAFGPLRLVRSSRKVRSFQVE